MACTPCGRTTIDNTCLGCRLDEDNCTCESIRLETCATHPHPVGPAKETHGGSSYHDYETCQAPVTCAGTTSIVDAPCVHGGASGVCERCDGSGEDPTSAYGRGCVACPDGAAIERHLERMECAQAMRDMDATGQDQEAFDGVA